MTRLLLIRHGESEWNVQGRIQGHLGTGLSERGRAQALRTADELAPALAGRSARDAVQVWSSDLDRAAQTAAPLADALGIEVRADPRLRERSFGAWEGRRHADVLEEDGERWRRWSNGDATVAAAVGGEGADALVARVVPALRELLDGLPDDGVAVAVSHGGAIWHVVHRLLGLRERTLGPVGNAAISELHVASPLTAGPVSDGGPPPRLARYNEVGHLPAELRTGGRITAGQLRAPAG